LLNNLTCFEVLGDNDEIANGVIVDVGGPGISMEAPPAPEAAPEAPPVGGKIIYDNPKPALPQHSYGIVLMMISIAAFLLILKKLRKN